MPRLQRDVQRRTLRRRFNIIIMDQDYYNTAAKENRAEDREIKRTALAAARSVTNSVRRQEKYNAVRWPQIALEGLSAEELARPF